MKKTITDLYKEKEEQELEEGFLAGVQTAATVLGYSALSGITAFGGAMLVAAAVRGKVGSKIKNFFRKIAGKDIDMKKGASKLKNKSGVKSTYDSYKSSETAEKLSDVLEAIKRKDYEDATYAYRSSGMMGEPEAIRVMSLAITEEFGEPPLYYISPGNESYQFLKRIVGPRIAKAVSDSVIYALNKNKSYFTDVEVMRPSEED
jgi:hypothetical protein